MEQRRLLAVTAGATFLAPSTYALWVTGDALDNRITVQLEGSATVVVRDWGKVIFEYNQGATFGGWNGYITKISVDAGPGNDRVRARVTRIFGETGELPVTVDGGPGDDTILTGTGQDTLTGGPGNDTIKGRGGIDIIRGNENDDTLDGGGGNDEIWGGDGMDTMSGGSGNDTMDGGDHDDTMRGGNDDDRLLGRAGNDTIFGGSGNDFMHGGDQNDTMNGGVGNDTIFGGNHNDTMRGGVGRDEMWGYKEIYTSFGDENDGDDTMYGDDNRDLMYGNRGNDTMYGGDGNDTMHGVNGDDRMFGGDDDDEMYGDDDDDTMFGGSGEDIMDGGRDDDEMNGGRDDDRMRGGLGNDTMNGGAANDEMHGGDDRDTMNGNRGNDTMHGGSGADTMKGGAGLDTMNGDDAPDIMDGGRHNDVMTGGPGDDEMKGGQGNDTMEGQGGRDSMVGGKGNDTMKGGDNNDRMFGGDDDDTMEGNAGCDLLNGDSGNDHLSGGTENDLLFAGEPGIDTVVGDAGVDIGYGTQGDTLQVEIANPQVQFTDPLCFSVEVAGLTIPEGNEGTTRTVLVTVTRGGDAQDAVTVRLDTTDGTATADEDYRPTSQTLDFAPGEREKTVEIEILGDGLVEPDETFGIETFYGEDHKLNEIELTILNDDATGTSATDDFFTTDQNTAVVRTAPGLLDNDSGAGVLRVTQVNGSPANVDHAFTLPSGALVTVSGDGAVHYDPLDIFDHLIPGEDFADTFTYTIENDVDQTEDTATVRITITGVNDDPTAGDDFPTTDEDVPIRIPVLGNDSDIDDDILFIGDVSDPPHGSVVVNLDGTITYTPDENYHGNDSFTYTVLDGNGGSDEGDVFVTINPVNDPPVALDDPFSVLGNLGIEVPASDGALSNDGDPDGDPIGVVPFKGTSNAGGTVEMAADGSILYTPAPGFQGPDTFTYTVIDPDGLEDEGTVLLDVIGMIWFIDNSSAGANLGTPLDPFTTLDAFEASPLPGPGDSIFIAETGTDYSSGITLQDGQEVIGEGAVGTSLEFVLGITPPPFSVTLPPINGTSPVIISPTGHGVDLATGNTIRGLDIGSTLGAGVFGSNFGTLTVSDVNITGSGPILDLVDGTVDVTLGDLESTGGAGTGIRLNNVAGTFEQEPGGGTSILDAQTGIDISGSSAAFAFGSVSINTAEGDGVILSNNGPSSIFSFDGLSVTTGSGRGLVAENSGTITITGSGNTISTTGGTAVDIFNTTIGPGGITFQSIDASDPPIGILLDNTGTSGGFTVTGDGTGAANGSGGTIGGATGPGIFLRDTTDASIFSMTITAPGDGGIRATDLQGTNRFEGNGIFDPSGPAIDLALGKETEVDIVGNTIVGFVPNEGPAISVRTVDPGDGSVAIELVALSLNSVEAVSLAEPLVRFFAAPGTELKVEASGNRFINYGSTPRFAAFAGDASEFCLDLNSSGEAATQNFANGPVFLARTGTATFNVAGLAAPSDGPTTAVSVAADNDFLGGVLANDGGGLFLPGLECFGPVGTGLSASASAVSPETYTAALDQILADASPENDEADPDGPAVDLLLSGQG